MERKDRIEAFANYINEWLQESDLHLTVENVRRYFALKYGKLPSERGILQIYKVIEGAQK